MRYLILLAALALGACSQTPVKTSAGNIDKLGSITDLHSGATLTPEQLLTRLAQQPRVILGEKHDNPYHHQIEQWLVQQLPLRRPQGSVLMEMINPNQQAQVDKVKRWLQSDPTVRDGRVAELIAWQPGWKWELYGGVTMAAMRAPYPLWSANLDRSEITAFYQQPQFPAGSYRRSRRCARRWKRPSALRTAARLRPTSCRRCWRSSSSATGAWRNVCWRRRRPRC